VSLKITESEAVDEWDHCFHNRHRLTHLEMNHPKKKKKETEELRAVK
jgi:hypothetical protein